MTAHAKRKQKTLPPTKSRNQHPSTQQLEAYWAWLECCRELPKGKKPSVAMVSAKLGLSPTGARPLLQACEAKGLLVRPVVTTRGPYEMGPEGRKWLPRPALVKRPTGGTVV